MSRRQEKLKLLLRRCLWRKFAKTLHQPQKPRAADFLELDYILLVPLDRAIGEKSCELMLGGYSKLKPPDAIHMATAIVANAHEMHTFDQKLLDLNEVLAKADGSKLKICKPDPGSSLPLFER